MDEILRFLLLPLLLAGVGELALNRTLSRATIFMPKSPVAEAILSGLSSVGFFLLALAFLLAVAWLGAWALRPLLAFEGRTKRVLPSLTLLFAILGVAAILGPGAPVALTFAALFVLILALLLRGLWVGGWERRVLFTAIVASYTLYVAGVILSQIGSLVTSLPLSAVEPLARAGEIVALLVTPFLFLTESQSADGRLVLRMWTSTIAAIPAAVFAFLVNYNRALVANVSIWSTGFSLSLPWPVYVAAIWLYTAGIIGAWNRGRRNAFLGYLFILVAGYNLNLTYTYVLAVIALILLLPRESPFSWTAQVGTRREDPAPGSAP